MEVIEEKDSFEQSVSEALMKEQNPLTISSAFQSSQVQSNPKAEERPRERVSPDLSKSPVRESRIPVLRKKDRNSPQKSVKVESISVEATKASTYSSSNDLSQSKQLTQISQLASNLQMLVT
jgi:hypothetical protein